MPQMNADYPYKEVTERVISAAYTVHNTLGSGFLESVYVRALVIELMLMGIEVEAEVPIEVRYRGEPVGDFRADLLVSKQVIVEVKAVNMLATAHEVQLVNYLRGTALAVGLLINFSRSVQIRRKIQSRNLRQSAASA